MLSLQLSLQDVDILAHDVTELKSNVSEMREAAKRKLTNAMDDANLEVVGKRPCLANQSAMSLFSELHEKILRLEEKREEDRGEDQERITSLEGDVSLLKKGSDSYNRMRTRTLYTYRRDHMGGSTSRNRTRKANKLVHGGDLIIDTNLCTTEEFTDVEVFEVVYALDLKTASRLVESKNTQLIGLFNRFATLKLAGGNILEDVENRFKMLHENLMQTEPIPTHHSTTSGLTTSCKELRTLLPLNV